jgi:hypothetical protein
VQKQAAFGREWPREIEVLEVEKFYRPIYSVFVAATRISTCCQKRPTAGRGVRFFQEQEGYYAL